MTSTWKHLSWIILVLIFSLSFAVPATAEVGLQRMGIRGGLSLDVDQILVGGQLDMGTLLDDKVRFEPNAELGFGDDYTTIGVAGDFKYLFASADVTPFATVGLQFTYYDYEFDNKLLDEKVDDSDSDLSLNLGGGIYFPLGGRDCFLDGRFGVDAGAPRGVP